MYTNKVFFVIITFQNLLFSESESFKTIYDGKLKNNNFSRVTQDKNNYDCEFIIAPSFNGSNESMDAYKYEYERAEYPVTYFFPNSNTNRIISKRTSSLPFGPSKKIIDTISEEVVIPIKSKCCLPNPESLLCDKNSVLSMPSTSAENESKEFNLMVEHFFRTHDRKWIFQEYHVTIECNKKILQEYSGVVHVDQKPTSSYEKLEFIPKYSDSKPLDIVLNDCSFKSGNLQELCVRARFSVKEKDNPNSKNNLPENQKTEPKQCVDEETQWRLSDVSQYIISRHYLGVDEKFSFGSFSKIKKASDNSMKMGKEPQLNSKANFNNWEKSIETLLESPINKRNKAVRESQSADSLLTYLNAKKEEKKNGRQQIIKVNKQFTKKKTFFVYDRIQKDPFTGKTVFIGSFQDKKGKFVISTPSLKFCFTIIYYH